MIYNFLDEYKTMLIIAILSLIVLCCLGSAPKAQAQCSPVQSDLLIATGLDAFDHFGNRVDISGDWSVVAAQQDDELGLNAGAAYMYHFDGTSWVQADKLLPPDGAADDYFGYDVAISGNTVVVGSWHNSDPGPPSSYGAAYVYVYNGNNWVFQWKLRAGGAYGSDYGTSVAIDGDTILVGASGHYTTQGGRGVAYLYQRTGNTWSSGIALSPTSGGTQVHKFGDTVDISGSTLVIGAYGDREMGDSAGSVFIFDANTHLQVQKIYATTPSTYEEFGRSLAIDGDTLIIQSRDYSDTYDGKIFVYEHDGSSWIEVSNITQPLATSNSGSFGQFRIAIAGNYILANESYQKRVYLFHNDGSQWVDEGYLLPLDGANGGIFGSGIAVDGNRVIVGDQLHRDEGIKLGAAYIFDPGCEGISAAVDIAMNPGLTMHQNYPNPFNPSTNIMFSLGEPANVELAVYGVSGDLIKTLIVENMDSGSHRVRWNGRNQQGRPVSSGVYFARLIAGAQRQTTRMLLMK